MKQYILNNYYNFITMWFTASVLFFLVEYVTNWIEVVTLGGLIAGSFIEGLFILLGLKLSKVIVGKDFFLQSIKQVFNSNYGELVKAVIAVSATTWEGALTIARLMPGYTFHLNILHVIFLILVLPCIMLVAKIQVGKN